MINYRISPNGTLLETKSGKKCMKNNNCLSELILTNIRLSDSGIYKLSTCTGTQSKDIAVTLFVEGELKYDIFLKSINSESCVYNLYFRKTKSFIHERFKLNSIIL